MRHIGDGRCDEDERSTRSIAGLAAVLFVVVISLVVIRKLQVRSMLEDCLLTQRPACEVALDRLRVSRAIDSIWDRWQGALATP